MRKIILVSGFMILSSVASVSWATAIFDSSAYAKLTYSEITGAGSATVSISELSATPGGHITASGNATGSFTETASTNGGGSSLSVGEWIELESTVGGSATNGDVSGASAVQGILDIANTSSNEDVTLEFLLEYSLDFSTGADPGDAAEAFLDMLVVAFDPIASIDVVDILWDTTNGDPDASGSGNQLITIKLGALESGGIIVFLSADGSADAPSSVPAPGIPGLFILGLGTLGLSRKFIS